MYITITGELGSGKSTVAKLLNQKYGYELYSTGSIQREIAKEKGITTLELNQQMTNDIHNIYDKMIDNKTVELSEKNIGKNIVFDSRMAWHFVKESFKVYVTVDIYVAAKRVLTDDRGKEEHYDSAEEAAKSLLKRKQLEDARFAEMYSVDTTAFSNYDLVIDSTDLRPEELAEFIMDKLNGESKTAQIFLAPERLFPTWAVRDIDSETVIQSGESEETINVAKYNGCYYIISGHRSVCLALRNKERLIAVRMLPVNEDGFVEKDGLRIDVSEKKPETYYSAWEEYNDMKFSGYPD